MTGGSLTARPLARERRSSRSRRSLELLLDGFFRPGGWAAALTYRLRLQGTMRATHSVVAVAGRDAAATALRIAFASDFHAGSTTHHHLLDDACAALAGFEPDVLLLGGDFVSVRAEYIRQLGPLLVAIPAPYGKFAVLGNHDLRANYPKVVAALEQAGITMITNRSVRLAAPFGDMSICGLDDPLLGK